jgi:hypothetical protein
VAERRIDIASRGRGTERLDLIRSRRIVVSLSGGREVWLQPTIDGEEIVIVDGPREIVEIAIDGAGVRVRATRARLEVDAAEDLELSARRVAIRATEALALRSEGDAEVHVRGSRTTIVRGDERLEASAIELQARDQHVDVRAQGPVRIDGEHIGLNDDPCPHRFAWSVAERLDAEDSEP